MSREQARSTSSVTSNLAWGEQNGRRFTYLLALLVHSLLLQNFKYSIRIAKENKKRHEREYQRKCHAAGELLPELEADMDFLEPREGLCVIEGVERGENEPCREHEERCREGIHHREIWLRFASRSMHMRK